MDPDPGGYFNSSAIFKTLFLTILLTAFYFYRTEKTRIFFRQPLAKKDTVATVINRVKPKKKKKKTIYLTFDDGPNKGTKKLMHIVNEEQVQVTLFVIGEHVYGSRAQSAIFDSVCNNSLFEIANHSYTHAFENNYKTFYALPDSVVNDFIRCADSLHLSSRIIRTPGRNIWRTENLRSTDLKSSTAAADSLQKNGFIAIGWDLEWHFNDSMHVVQSADELLQEVDSLFSHNKTKTADQLVLLAHDQVYATLEDSAALHNFIIGLKNKDEYNIECISKYPGLVSP